MARITLMEQRRQRKREARAQRKRAPRRHQLSRRRRAIAQIRAHIYRGAWFDEYEHMADDRYRIDPLRTERQ
jgi:hypothetical protein